MRIPKAFILKFYSYILLLFFLGITHLQAQRNYKFENFGNRSILLNGNVTGSVDDLGATYYNPARLALVEDPVFSINAKIYQLTDLRIDNITVDGQDVSSSEFDGIPSMVAGTFKLKFLEGHQFAYSLFSRNRSNLSINYNTTLIDGEELDDPFPYSYIGTTYLTNDLREYWYGVSWAKSIKPSFSIGASLFFSTYKFKGGLNQQFNSINEEGEISTYQNNSSFQQKSSGFFLKVGAAWVLPKVDLGVNLDLPYIEIKGDGRYKYEEYFSSNEFDDVFTFNDFRDLDAKRKYPLGVSFGAGFPLKKHKIHVSTGWYASVGNYSKIDVPPLESETEENLEPIYFNEELKSIVNFGVGAEIFITEKLNAYGSFSTDFSPYISTASIFDAANQSGENINVETNYSHYALGINVTHKWANFILGSVYSRGNTGFTRPINIPGNTDVFTDQNSKIILNRWRFLIGIEVLFLEKTLNKHGIDKKIIIQ